MIRFRTFVSAFVSFVLLLGGGLGHLTRKCGLSIDNLLEADVVTADGQLVTTSAHAHPDLSWALRRRELRRRHVAAIPAPPGRHSLWRPDDLANRAGGRHHALVPRLYHHGAR
jgi:hypothetical protein